MQVKGYQVINPQTKLSKKISEKRVITGITEAYTRDLTFAINNASEGMAHKRPIIPDVPIHPGPILRPPPKPIRSNILTNQQSSHSSTSTGDTNINSIINIEFEENSPFQEGIISENYQRPDKSFYQEPKELEKLINTDNFIQKFLPKQADIDRILKVIQRKVVKGTHLLVEVKEIQVSYSVSPYFKDVYLYLPQNNLPCSKAAIRKVETLAERYVLLDSLLFTINPEKVTAALAIPETCADKIIT